jgi:hypothetical protein
MQHDDEIQQVRQEIKSLREILREATLLYVGEQEVPMETANVPISEDDS